MQMFMTTACIAARWINTSQTVWFRMLVFGIFVLCSITKQGYIDAKRHTQLQGRISYSKLTGDADLMLVLCGTSVVAAGPKL